MHVGREWWTCNERLQGGSPTKEEEDWWGLQFRACSSSQGPWFIDIRILWQTEVRGGNNYSTFSNISPFDILHHVTLCFRWHSYALQGSQEHPRSLPSRHQGQICPPTFERVTIKNVFRRCPRSPMGRVRDCSWLRIPESEVVKVICWFKKSTKDTGFLSFALLKKPLGP